MGLPSKTVLHLSSSSCEGVVLSVRGKKVCVFECVCMWREAGDGERYLEVQGAETIIREVITLDPLLWPSSVV